MNLGMLARVFLVANIFGQATFAAGGNVKLDHADIDLSDSASLQRGAQIYVNNCLGCHGLIHTRYDSIARGIEITDEEGEILDDVVKSSLIFTGEKMSSPVNTSMTEKDGAAWFGASPPDLSLVTRSRGTDWLYTYLRTFYKDETRPWGYNNLTFPGVGMPHILEGMQGVQVLEDGKLKLVEPGSLTQTEYDNSIRDLVNFLTFVGEPVKLTRQRLGVWVLMFLGIIFVFSYLLKREYWKDIH